MAELLFWNTLSESANWLGETLGEQVTPKSLIQKILDRAVLVTKPLTGAPLPPTVIKALLPRGVRIASVWLFPKQSDVGEFEKRMNERMVQVHGVPVTGGIYTGHVQKQVIPLLPFQIADLITHGNIEIGLVHENQLDGYKFRESECGFILPVGTPHVATLETCGINRDDLLALADQLSANDAGDSDHRKASDRPSSASKHSSNINPSRDTDLTSEILKAKSKALDPSSDIAVWTALRDMALDGEGLFTGLVNDEGLHYEKSSGGAATLNKSALSKRLTRLRSKGTA